MGFPLDQLARTWASCELPGYRPHPAKYATYSGFEYDELPPIERALDDDLAWLECERAVEPSIASDQPGRAREATSTNLSGLLADEFLALPPSFTAFVGDLDLQQRVRSCTDCYLDLGDFVVDVEGAGSLIHILSDSQWVLHWLLYVGETAEAVIVTPSPLGFELGEESIRRFELGATAAAVCAPSFNEFIYRLWLENELWFSLAVEHSALTAEQQRYLDHYGHSRP